MALFHDHLGLGPGLGQLLLVLALELLGGRPFAVSRLQAIHDARLTVAHYLEDRSESELLENVDEDKKIYYLRNERRIQLNQIMPLLCKA